MKKCSITINSTDCIVKYDATTCTCDRDKIITDDENFIISNRDNITLTDNCYISRGKLTQCPTLSTECKKINGMLGGGITCTVVGIFAIIFSIPAIAYIWKKY